VFQGRPSTRPYDAAVDQAELERLLEGGEETQTFEVKCRMTWNVKKLARDILAMANVRDGGTIVIGVVDGTFVREGVDDATKATYNPDTMRDQLAAYADPHVRVTVHLLSDSKGTEYVAIRVHPFRELPVICKLDSNDTKAGAIYYRTTNRRPESAVINNSYDMRDLIMTAVARVREGLSRLGLQVTSTTSEFSRQLDNELGGL
jgi:predicted HTH transcriptional regulator